MKEVLKGSLEGIKVIDFSTLLPGPLASLFLSETGAEVIKIEKPGVGDEIRLSNPQWGEQSVSFSLLNRGKKSLSLDLWTIQAWRNEKTWIRLRKYKKN